MAVTVPPTRKQRNRERIIAVATEVFFREGYATASMSQISVALGGSKRTLYNHFTTKEQLLRAVVDDVVTPKPAPSAEPMRDDFRRWLAWFGAAVVMRGTAPKFVALQRLAAAEAMRFPEIGRLIEAALMTGSGDAVQPFAEAMTEGVLRKGDPMIASAHFVEMCAGWTLRRVVWNLQAPPTKREIETQVAAAISTFMDGWGPGSMRKSRPRRAPKLRG